MNDKRFVANVYHTADTVASVKCSTGTRVIFHRAMVVAMLNILQVKKRNGTFFNLIKYTSTYMEIILNYIRSDVYLLLNNN